jgi:hypothetical protein
MTLVRTDALAAHVEVLQHGRVPVGEPRMLDILGSADGRRDSRSSGHRDCGP